MLAYEPAAISVPTATPQAAPVLETDPVKNIARAMVELQAQGRIVDRDALVAYGRFTRAEVDAHADAAGDLAILMTRDLA